MRLLHIPPLAVVAVTGSVIASLAPAPVSAQEVPHPNEVFGFELGADYHLGDYDAVVEYFRALDQASDRVEVEQIGTTTLGRPMLLAFISSPENLARRDRIREINRRLSHARGLTDEEARALVAEGLPTVWIDGGLHATEVAHTLHTPELAHWLANGEDEEARRIRENVMVLLMPNINPDGMDIVTGWYRSNLGTPFETADLPGLYHHYIGHDNNRDWYMFTQAETQVASRIFYEEWFPQLIYNHHQTGPFPGRIWVPPPADPLSPTVDPVIPAGLSTIGQYMLKRFMAEGKPGVSTGIGYRVSWGGGFMVTVPQLHNMYGFFTETALYKYATPHCYDEDEIGEMFTRNIPMKTMEPSMKYPVPWAGGCWHIRDAMDYMMTGSKAVLDLASRVGDQFLYDTYFLGRRQIERGEAAEDGPFAWVIDASDQHDPGAALRLLRVLRHGGVEVRRAESSFRVNDTVFPEGAYVIGPQAYRPFVIDLMETRRYPDRFDYPGGPPETPYDFTGYNLPDQLGVTVARVYAPFDLPEDVIDEVRPDPGQVTGGSYGHVLAASSNESYRAVNRLLAGGARVARLAGDVRVGEVDLAAGAFLIRDADRAALDRLAGELGLDFHGVDGPPEVSAHAIRAPRIGLYKSWVTTMPEGWTRWVLDTYEFQADTLHDADLTAGRLADYDILIFPDQTVEGIRQGHADLALPEQYTGGVGASGTAAIDAWVRDGGWILGAHQSVEFVASALGLPVRNRIASVDARDFYIPGSLMRVEVDPSDPMAWGMQERASALFWRHAHVMRVLPAASEEAASGGDQTLKRPIRTFASFPESDLLADGWAIGAEEHLAGAPAGLLVPHGQGRAVLLGFRPNTRGQPGNTFKLLFNPLYASTMEEVPPRADGGG
jgi:hypothetical protein